MIGRLKAIYPVQTQLILEMGDPVAALLAYHALFKAYPEKYPEPPILTPEKLTVYVREISPMIAQMADEILEMDRQGQHFFSFPGRSISQGALIQTCMLLTLTTGHKFDVSIGYGGIQW